MANELDQQINKIGNVLGTRWVASSFRAVTAALYGYGALYRHFESAKVDKVDRLPNETMYNGLSKKLSSTEFILNLAIMYDVLAELSESAIRISAKPGNNRLLCRQNNPEEYFFLGNERKAWNEKFGSESHYKERKVQRRSTLRNLKKRQQ